MPVVSVTDIAPSSVSDASMVNSNFASIRNAANDLDAANLSGSAALAVTKLAAGANGQAVVNLSGTRQYRMTMLKIADSVLGGNQTEVAFTGIPGDYYGLLLICMIRGSAAGGSCFIELNNAVYFGFGEVYSNMSNVTPVFSGAWNGGTGSFYAGQMPDSTSTASHFGLTRVWFPFYAGSTNKKSIFVDSGSSVGMASGNLSLHCGSVLTEMTAAITQISIFNGGGVDHVTGSAFALYGVG